MTEIIEISDSAMHWYKMAMENKQARDAAVCREEELHRTINAQKVELASRNLRILGLEETLQEAERFVAYFAEERTSFEGPGTPLSCLARIRRMLPQSPQDTSHD